MALGFRIIKTGFVKIFESVEHINNTTKTITGITWEVSEKGRIISKTVGATTGTVQFAKSSVDLAEAIVCQDGVCAVISAVGCVADGVQILGSFIPGPNITTAVTTPISWGCKMFVWCCKRSKLPWGGC